MVGNTQMTLWPFKRGISPVLLCTWGACLHLFVLIYAFVHIYISWVFNIDSAPRMKRHYFLLPCKYSI